MKRTIKTNYGGTREVTFEIVGLLPYKILHSEEVHGINGWQASFPTQERSARYVKSYYPHEYARLVKLYKALLAEERVSPCKVG